MKESSSFRILLFLVFFTSALFSILSPMAVDIEKAISDINQAQVLQIVSIFLAVGAFSSLIWASLVGRLSRKKLLIIATLIWSLAELVSAFATSFLSLLIPQIIAAVGFGAVMPITYSLIVDLFQAEERGKAFGLKEMFYVLGIGFAFILAGFLVGLFPWYVPVFVVAIGGFISVGFLFMLEEPKKIELTSSDESREWINVRDLKEVFTVRSNVWILISYFAVFIGYGAVSPSFTTFLRNDYKFAPSIATIFLIVSFIGQIPSGIIFGKLGDKLYEENKNGRIKVALLCLIGGSIFNIIAFSLILTTTNLPLIILFVILTLLGATFFGGFDPLIQASLGEINKPRFRSTAYAFVNLILIFGRSISLFLLSLLLVSFSNFYRPGLIILSVVALICSVLLLPLLKTIPEDLKESEF